MQPRTMFHTLKLDLSFNDMKKFMTKFGGFFLCPVHQKSWWRLKHPIFGATEIFGCYESRLLKKHVCRD